MAIYQKLADDNPAVTEFRSSLAWSRDNLGWLLWHREKLAEAEAEVRNALAIYQKLADDNPTDIRSSLAQNHFTLGHVLSGRYWGHGGGRVPQVAVDPAEAG